MTYTKEQIWEMLEKSTPGPWHVGKLSYMEEVFSTAEPKLNAGVATCWGTNENKSGDSRLIAAAPQLAKQLLALIDFVEGWKENITAASNGFKDYQIKLLTSKLDIAMKALEFYANPEKILMQEIWDKELRLHQQVFYGADSGTKAQEAVDLIAGEG